MEGTIVYTRWTTKTEIGFLVKKHDLKAQLSYYEGEFEWAQAQLNILEATSELVSNDAIQLSVFITDNLGLDSNMDAMMGYA